MTGLNQILVELDTCYSYHHLISSGINICFSQMTLLESDLVIIITKAHN